MSLDTKEEFKEEPLFFHVLNLTLIFFCFYYSLQFLFPAKLSQVVISLSFSGAPHTHHFPPRQQLEQSAVIEEVDGPRTFASLNRMSFRDVRIAQAQPKRMNPSRF
jgi:hypothetical protein